MQVYRVIAPVFATNCCIVMEGNGEPGSDAVIVDPGAGVADTVISVVGQRQWNVQAVLATHGHVDHTWDAARLCEEFSVPFRVHAEDAYRIADPFGTLGADTDDAGSLVAQAVEQGLKALGSAREDYRAPEPLVTFTESGDDGEGNLIAGTLRIPVIHAPGHTEGASIFQAGGLVLTGDVLFAGAAGRTDLPGGDSLMMVRSLKKLKGMLDPSLGVVPGHGTTTTVQREIDTNPYLV
ncbi:MAG: MBL fold metallo-hydrolase [Cellulomonadaceae bacterium]|jgi:glyoxylase-like metal-dependent hydrolase (beta-lactamase superfamily II)|nr:MBL fold metallo-hydrolase [Cellulomonadaceae bacterium]